MKTYAPTMIFRRRLARLRVGRRLGLLAFLDVFFHCFPDQHGLRFAALIRQVLESALYLSGDEGTDHTHLLLLSHKGVGAKIVLMRMWAGKRPALIFHDFSSARARGGRVEVSKSIKQIPETGTDLVLTRIKVFLTPSLSQFAN
jgi:hypothetical protein